MEKQDKPHRMRAARPNPGFFLCINIDRLMPQPEKSRGKSPLKTALKSCQSILKKIKLRLGLQDQGNGYNGSPFAGIAQLVEQLTCNQ